MTKKYLKIIFFVIIICGLASSVGYASSSIGANIPGGIGSSYHCYQGTGGGQHKVDTIVKMGFSVYLEGLAKSSLGGLELGLYKGLLICNNLVCNFTQRSSMEVTSIVSQNLSSKNQYLRKSYSFSDESGTNDYYPRLYSKDTAPNGLGLVTKKMAILLKSGSQLMPDVLYCLAENKFEKNIFETQAWTAESYNTFNNDLAEEVKTITEVQHFAGLEDVHEEQMLFAQNKQLLVSVLNTAVTLKELQKVLLSNKDMTELIKEHGKIAGLTLAGSVLLWRAMKKAPVLATASSYLFSFSTINHLGYEMPNCGLSYAENYMTIAEIAQSDENKAVEMLSEESGLLECQKEIEYRKLFSKKRDDGVI